LGLQAQFFRQYQAKNLVRADLGPKDSLSLFSVTDSAEPITSIGFPHFSPGDFVGVKGLPVSFDWATCPINASSYVNVWTELLGASVQYFLSAGTAVLSLFLSVSPEQ